MSSFPEHEDNIKALDAMGFDVSDSIENGEVIFESWGYDELVNTMSNIIHTLEENNFKIEEKE